MPNIFDYLEWRADLSLKADPFNDVDNLILAELAYTEFDGLVPEDGTKVSLESVRDGYFATHSKAEAMGSDNHILRAPVLMDGMLEGERFRGLMLSDYINIIDTDSDLQISAVTFNLSDGSRYIAFRGTDNTVVGWKEDFNMSYLPETGGQRKAIEYLNRVGSEKAGKLLVGGHSKGGNFAVYASAFCDASVRERILEVDTNDGPGFIQEVAESEEMKVICPKIRSLVPDESLFGLMMYGIYGHEVIKSSARRVFQHDAQTWLVEGNHFERAEKGLTEASILLDKTLTGWVANVEPKQRKKFVDFIFDVLDTSGADTLAELHQNRIRNFAELIRAAYSMDKERKNQFSEVLSVLAKNGKNVLASELKKTIDEAMKGH